MKNIDRRGQDAATPDETTAGAREWPDEPYLLLAIQTRRKAEAAIESEYGIRLSPDIQTPPYVERLIREEYERRKATALRCACRTVPCDRNRGIQEQARRIRDAVETERWRKHDD